MKNQNASNPVENFQVEDPLAVFEAFSREEIRRWQNTDPDFDATLPKEAIALVLNRLKTPSTTSI